MLYKEPLETVSFTLPRFLVEKLDTIANSRQDSRSRVLRSILEMALTAEQKNTPAPDAG